MKHEGFSDDSDADWKVISQFVTDLLDNGDPVEEFHVLLSQRPNQSTIDDAIKTAHYMNMICTFCPQHIGAFREKLYKELDRGK